MLYEIGFDLIKWNMEGLLSRSTYFLCQINVFESFELQADVIYHKIKPIILISFNSKPRARHAVYLQNMAPGRCGSKFDNITFILLIQNSSLGVQWEIALWWMPQKLAKEKSTLLQVMACCLTAPSHYLNHCEPRSLWPYCITSPQYPRWEERSVPNGWGPPDLSCLPLVLWPQHGVYVAWYLMPIWCQDICNHHDGRLICAYQSCFNMIDRFSTRRQLGLTNSNK